MSGTPCAKESIKLMSRLFEHGSFILHSGSTVDWRINCDVLTDGDWDSLAKIAVDILPPFGSVEGVPTGGTKFADALLPYVTKGSLLIADDVLTTGTSMIAHCGMRCDVIGVVVFARHKPLHWVTPIFQLWM